MKNIQLLNGQNAIVGSQEDIIYEIREHMGCEFADYISEFLDIKVQESAWEQKALRQEMRTYEGSLESIDNVLRDSVEELEELMEYINDSKRINKEKIYSKINEICKNLKEEL